MQAGVVLRHCALLVIVAQRFPRVKVTSETISHWGEQDFVTLTFAGPTHEPITWHGERANVF